MLFRTTAGSRAARCPRAPRSGGLGALPSAVTAGVVVAVLGSGCSATPLSAASAAHAAVILRSCGVGLISSDANSLMAMSTASVDPFTDRLLECAATAASCTAFQQCTARGRLAQGAPPGGRCDGDTIVASVLGVPSALDCGVWAGGGTCAMGAIGVRCVPRSGCPADTTAPPRCDGRVAVDCSDPEFAALDCGVVEPGATCVMQNGRPACVPQGRTACAPELAGARCDGDTLVQCSTSDPRGSLFRQYVTAAGTRFEYRTDCAAIGMRCAPEQGCVPRESTCADLSGGGQCEGASLALCVAGRRERVACASVGLARCEFSRCVP